MVIGQCLKMAAKKKRRKTQLPHLSNVTSFAWSLMLLLIRANIYYLGKKFMKQDLYLCMHMDCLVWPGLWPGTLTIQSISFSEPYPSIFSSLCVYYPYSEIRFALILSKTVKLEVDLASVNIEEIEDVLCRVWSLNYISSEISCIMWM